VSIRELHRLSYLFGGVSIHASRNIYIILFWITTYSQSVEKGELCLLEIGNVGVYYYVVSSGVWLHFGVLKNIKGLFEEESEEGPCIKAFLAELYTHIVV